MSRLNEDIISYVLNSNDKDLQEKIALFIKERNDRIMKEVIKKTKELQKERK